MDKRTGIGTAALGAGEASGALFRRWSPLIALVFLIGIACLPLPATPFSVRSPKAGTETSNGVCRADAAASEAVLHLRTGQHASVNCTERPRTLPDELNW